MDFVFKIYLRPEFDSLLFGFLRENNIHLPGEIAEYYSERDYMLRVVVSDRIIVYLNAEQVQALKSMG